MKLHQKKRTRGTYYLLRWVDSRGKPREKSLGLARKSGGKLTRAEAERKRRALEQAIGTAEFSRDRPRSVRLSQFAEWHENVAGFRRRSSTLAEWRTAVKHALAAMGDVEVHRIDRQHVGLVRRYLEGKGRSEATVRKTLVTLRAMLATAVRHGVGTVNALAGEQLGTPPVAEIRVYEPLEVDALVKASPDKWWAGLIRLAYETGLRRGELMHLRWCDVDEDAAELHVVGRRAGVHKVGDVELPIAPWEPKTRNSTRTVPLTPRAAAVLPSLRIRAGGSPYVFTSPQRLLRLQALGKLETVARQDGAFSRAFREIQDGAAAELKVDNWQHGTFHDLRKSFATRAATAGVPIRELQGWLGHASIETTALHYTAIEASAADRLRAVFS